MSKTKTVQFRNIRQNVWFYKLLGFNVQLDFSWFYWTWQLWLSARNNLNCFRAVLCLVVVRQWKVEQIRTDQYIEVRHFKTKTSILRQKWNENTMFLFIAYASSQRSAIELELRKYLTLASTGTAIKIQLGQRENLVNKLLSNRRTKNIPSGMTSRVVIMIPKSAKQLSHAMAKVLSVWVLGRFTD